MNTAAQIAAQHLTHTTQNEDLGKKSGPVMTKTQTQGTWIGTGFRALIDLDPLAYQYGGILGYDGKPSPKLAERLVVQKIEKILEAIGSDEWKGFLTFGPDNFRNKVATIKPYKGNRKDREKPPLYDHIRSFLTDFDEVSMVFGQEADDAMSIEQWSEYNLEESNYYSYIEDDPIEQGMLGSLVESLSSWQCKSIVCTPDKDLNMVPGWHYRWSTTQYEEIKPWFQDKISGLRFFYKQCLCGDSVDFIHGLYGISWKSKRLDELDKLDSEVDMAAYVLDLYRKWYGSYAEKFLTETGQLLWMRSKPDEYWSIPK